MTEAISTLRVSEIFGPTIQGEGALAGHRTMFVRLGGCDFRCSWCDTPHAVLEKHRREWTKWDVDDIVTELKGLAGVKAKTDRLGLVTLSGGNPCAQDCSVLVKAIKDEGGTVAVETQGSLAPGWLKYVDRLTISPKPPSAGVDFDPNTVKQCISMVVNSHVSIKFVIKDQKDMDWAISILPSINWWRDIYVQPCDPDVASVGKIKSTAQDREDRYRALCELALKTKWQAQIIVLPQLHVTAWGHDRGR